MTAASLCALAFAASSALAPDMQARQREPTEEIIVTGERTARSLRETPSSVVVTTEEEIEATGADRIEQLLVLIPNVQLGSGEEGPAIRGQDSTGVLRGLFAFVGGARPRATLQVDGRSLSYYESVLGSTATWDVERVEIFRSPQTTTQGRNSIAGAIFVETNDPTFDWEARGRAVIGELGTRQASSMVSGPVLEDQIAIRFAGDVRLSQMASDMADGIPGASIDRDDYGFARLKLLFQPTALPEARLETSYVHLRSQAPQFEAVRVPFRERRFPVPEQTNGIMRIRADSLTMRLGYRLSADLSATGTLSFGDARIRRFGLPGLGRTRADSRDFSAETNLEWRPTGPVTLRIGAHHLTLRQKQFIDVTGLGIGTGVFNDRQSSLGLFGETTWRPLAPLAITAGLRYQRDRQDRKGLVGSLALRFDEPFEALLPKVSVSYDLGPATTVGLLVQRAFNPGGTSINLRRRTQDDFAAETLWNYEVFFRSTLAGGRGTLSANLFYNDIGNAQRTQTVPVVLQDGTTIFSTEFANAPAAETYGMELELGWRAGKRVSLRGGIGLLGSRVRRTVLPSDTTRGKEFQRAPQLSAAATIDWRPTDPVRLSAQFRHHSGYFSDDANSPSRRIEATTVADLRAAYTAGSATLFGYVRNAFNSLNLTYLFSDTFGAAGDPREIGVGVEVRF